MCRARISDDSFCGGWHVEQVTPDSASDEQKRGGEADSVKLSPSVSGRKWCPSHLKAIRLSDAGNCPVCMAVPEAAYAPTASTDGRVRPVDCKDGARLNAGRVRDDVEFGAVVSRRQRRPLPCPGKGCGAPSAVLATGSYYEPNGERDFVWYEATCANGHSHFASRFAPESAAPAEPAVQAADVAPAVRALFESVVAERYAELLGVAEQRLGPRVPGADDCVQLAVAALLEDGAYSRCATLGEMFGQLVATVKNRAKGTLRDWARKRRRHETLSVAWDNSDDAPAALSWSDDEDLGDGKERPVNQDTVHARLRPAPVERTRDLRTDAKWAMFEAEIFGPLTSVPLDAQAVLVGEQTRRAVVEGRRARGFGASGFDTVLDLSRDYLVRRLADWRWRLRPFAGDDAEIRFLRRWAAGIRAEFKRASAVAAVSGLQRLAPQPPGNTSL